MAFETWTQDRIQPNEFINHVIETKRLLQA